MFGEKARLIKELRSEIKGYKSTIENLNKEIKELKFQSKLDMRETESLIKLKEIKMREEFNKMAVEKDKEMIDSTQHLMDNLVLKYNSALETFVRAISKGKK